MSPTSVDRCPRHRTRGSESALLEDVSLRKPTLFHIRNIGISTPCKKISPELLCDSKLFCNFATSSRDFCLGMMSYYYSVCYLFFAQWKRRKLVMKQPEQIGECSCNAWTFLSVVSGFPTTALRDKKCPRCVLVGEQKHP